MSTLAATFAQTVNISAASPQSGEMFIDKWPKRISSLRRSEICLSEPKRFAPNGARNQTFTVADYKLLAPNGAKTTT